MNTINGQIVVGAPHSDMRHKHAERICVNCLIAEKERGLVILRTAFMIADIPVTLFGQCYVCELSDKYVAVVKTVENGKGE